jgi:hypothetical protein
MIDRAYQAHFQTGYLAYLTGNPGCEFLRGAPQRFYNRACAPLLP